MRARRLARMTERLSLTPAQVQRIERIMEESATARQGARRNGDSRAATEAVRTRTRSAIQNVLTPAQRTAMEAMHSERGERGRRGPRGERGARGQRGGAPTN
jgi:Spy/CpxP family protein refolding chaperone